MKKVLWLMMLFPIFMSKVWASDVYYSEYGDFSEYQENLINGSDIIDVEQKTMYKWYKNIKVTGEYKLYNSNDNFLDNCYETKFSPWNSIKPVINEAMVLEQKTIYDYQMVEPVRYIHLYDVIGSYGAFRIPELQVYVNDKKIEYSYTCDGCWENFDKYINNNIYIENNSYIDNGGSLIIDLGEYYPINKLRILFYIFDMGDVLKEYTLGYSKNGSDIFIKKNFSHQFSSSYIPEAPKFEYHVTDLANSDLWLISKISEDYIDNEYVYSRNSYQQYRYKEKYCQTYKLEKEYYPQYSEQAIGEYNLKDTSKTFYRYRMRDKLVLNIYDITEKNYDLNKFVVSSTDDYNIHNNIDWDKNGQYQLIFTLNDLIVKDNVNVSIMENSLKEKDDEIKILQEKLNNTISDYENIIDSLEKSNEEYLKSLNKLNIKIIEINHEIEQLEALNDINANDILGLKNNLNAHIKEFQEMFLEQEKNNQRYTESLNLLNNSFLLLEEKMNNLQKNDSNIQEEIEKINNIIENYKNEIDNKMVEFDALNESYSNRLELLDKDIKFINEKIYSLEEKYEQLINKVLDIEKEIEELDKLNNDVENIKKEISSLKDGDIVQNEKIIELENNLKMKLDLYESNVENLEEFNNSCIIEINKIKDNIDLIEKELEELKKEENKNSLDIIDLKNELDSNLNLYNKKFEQLENFNKIYSQKLLDINIKINDLIIELEKNKIFNEDKYDTLIKQLNNSNLKIEIINNNIKELETLEYKLIELQEKIENLELNNNDLEQEQEKTKEQLNNYEQIIENLEKINLEYLILIEDMNNEIENISKKLNDLELNVDNNHSEIIKTQNDIEEQLVYNNLNKESMDEQLKIIKSDLVQVSKILENNEEENLNNSLNDFILKINGKEKINLIWLYILITLMFIVYIIYLFKKKSNKNNS